MNVCECLTVTAKLLPQQTAIVFGERAYSYEELNDLSAVGARQLEQLGVGPGDRVALMLPNVPAFPIWYYAVLRIGAIAVSVSTRLAPSEVAYIVKDCDAIAFVCGTSASEDVSAVVENAVKNVIRVSEEGDTDVTRRLAESGQWFDAAPNDPAVILYTSGTTGFPKGATLSHSNVRTNVHAFNHLCDMQTHDRILLAVPLFHCFGQNALLNSALNVGASLVMQQKFDPQESLRLIVQHQITQLYGVPTMFQLLQRICSVADLSSVRYCFSAAAPLPIQTSKLWLETFGQPICEGYGLTETSPFASYNHRVKYTMGSIGMAIDGVEMKIVDPESGSQCLPGQLGEIAIRGPNVMLGYWNRPDDTAAAVKEGWFHSGDIGQYDDAGFFYIVDRVKDMISVGGLKVFPAEVERVLLDHSDVVDVAVVGLADPVLGERVVAYVVLRANDDEGDGESVAPIVDDIRRFAETDLGAYKRPQQLFVVESIPRNPSGKVLKTKLRAQEVEVLFRSAASKMRDDVQADAFPSSGQVPGNGKEVVANPRLLAKLLRTAEAKRTEVAASYLQGLVKKIGGLDAEPPSVSTFIDAGLDSLMMVELSSELQLEGEALADVAATIVFDYPRICDLAEFLVDTLITGNAPNIDEDKWVPEQRGQLERPTDDLRAEIEGLSEDEALQELMKELG